MVGANVDPTLIGANVVVILTGFLLFWSKGTALFKGAVKDEIAPVTEQIVSHIAATNKVHKKLARQLDKHRADDAEKFGEVLTRLEKIDDASGAAKVAAEKVAEALVVEQIAVARKEIPT